MIDLRNRHDRAEHHFGDWPATLVALSSALDVYVEGATIEEVVAAIHARLTLLEDPMVLADDKAMAMGIAAPGIGETIEVTGNSPSFTVDATDPAEILNWASDGVGSYSGWLKLVVLADGVFRIHTYGSGMDDTIMAIWGPMSDPPGSSDLPYHLSDDGGPSGPDVLRSSFHDSGSDPNGTLFGVGDAYSVDEDETGIALEAGTWWVCVFPYVDTTWDTSEGGVIVTIERLS